MLNDEIKKIIAASRQNGWVMEPDANKILKIAGIDLPASRLAKSSEEAVIFAAEIGYPVACKVVSADIVHKSDVEGVVVGVADDHSLQEVFARFRLMPGFTGMLIAEMVSGVELIVGAKIDYQFGPVILLGIGGTGVEIYKDAVIRMAPIAAGDVAGMVSKLNGRTLLEGHRGSKPVNIDKLARMLAAFSELVIILEDQIESIDLNPVFCSDKYCLAADARIMLKDDSVN